jgi:hypothetical protein
MKKFTLSGKLAAFNRYLPIIYLIPSEEKDRAKEVEAAGFGYLISDSKPEKIFMYLLWQWLRKNISEEVKWGDVIRNEYNISTNEFTGIEYETDFNVITSAGAASPSDVLDMASYVNVDRLMHMKLLPHFASNLIDSITLDYANFTYEEGYDKKRGLCSGYWGHGRGASNLIIIDVSGSIPIGIADMMLYLASTMAYRLRADVIITGGSSKFFPLAEAVRIDPVETRSSISRTNESREFSLIMRDQINGKAYDNVVSFGDQDCWHPEFEDEEHHDVSIGQVYHFHTQKRDIRTGYAAWTRHFEQKSPIFAEPDDWCSMFTERREWN